MGRLTAKAVHLERRDRGKQFHTSVGAILGHFAMWAVRLSPYTVPDDLGTVLAALKKKLTKHVASLTLPKPEWELFVKFGWLDITERHLEDLLIDALFPLPEFVKWNTRKNGNDAPLGIRSAYDDPSKIDPDNEFIDLYALVGQVARSASAEAEAEHRER
jgi:hypothetical protein